MSQKINPISLDQLDPALKEKLEPAVERLGYFGDFFGYFGQTPDTLIKFMQFTGACKSHLSTDLNEVLALVVCSRLGGDYERIQHERLSDNLGYDRDWIGALTGLSPKDQATFTDEQLACWALAEKVIDSNGRDAAQEIDRVADLLGTEAALSALWQITRFTMICTLLNSFSMELPRASIFDN